ncbi:putative metal-dependent hydrolase [Methylorubrum extorquens]
MSTERYTLKVGDLDAEIVLKPIRNLHIGVYPPDGRVRVAAPASMTRAAVQGALALRLVWIRHRIMEFQRQQRETPREYRAGESHWHMGRRYRLRAVGHGRSNAVATRGHYIEVTVRGSPSSRKVASAIEQWRRVDLAERAKPIIAYWAHRLGTDVPDVGIKRMSTRWGTCSIQSKRVWLNLALSRLPPSCLNYVSLHEVAHLLVPNHSADFLALLDAHMPDWRAAKAMLSELPYSHSGTV